MGSACGVSWSGTASGDLDESAIPNDDFKSHYLNAGDTKSDSSFPVVDGEGNLRAGNVNSAWDLRGQGEGVSEECLRKLDNAFDEDVLPDTAYENSMTNSTRFADPPEWESGQVVQWVANPDMVGRIVHVPDDQNILMVDLLEKEDGEWQSTGYTLTAGYSDVRPKRNEQMAPQYSADEEQYGMNVTFSQLPERAVSDGFNKYGVRQNDDGSVDVRFKAMEPGVRRGVRITPEFLQKVAGYEYGRLPVQLDHSKSQRANVGYIKPENVKFSNGFLQLQAHIPNTGSSVRDDIIADFTHEPPQISDGSIAFDPETVEVSEPRSRDAEPEFTDARLREFSLTPFPAGYDNGGLTPEFSDAVEQAIQMDDTETDAESRLITRKHKLIKYE
jgi:hypothetical protein